MALSPIGNSESKWVATVRLSIIGLVCYQAALCFVNTNVAHLTNAAVAWTEGTILLIVAISTARVMRETYFAYVLYIIIYFIALWIIRGDMAENELRNILIMVMFFSIGSRVSDRGMVDKLLMTISVIVVVFGVLEYFFSDLYLKYFDILQYFASRGVVNGKIPTYLTQNLYLSGLRPEGRSIFPFLGDQRVSSVFLEPISLGNYAVIVGVWGLSYDLVEWRKAVKHIILAIIFIVACDSRFASLIILFVAFGRFVSLMQSRVTVFSMLFVAVLLLALYAAFGDGHAYEDNFSGRVMVSALAVLNMKLDNFLGIGKPEILADMGVAYSIENFGVVLCVVLWSVFSFMRIDDRYGKRIRVMIAIYCLGLLTISGDSFFSAKTSAILWFMFGASRGHSLRAHKSIERMSLSGAYDRWRQCVARSPQRFEPDGGGRGRAPLSGR